MLWTTLKRAFALDTRSLALFRIAFGVVLLVDTILRWSVMRALYTDQGVMPRSAYLEKFANLSHLSVFYLSGEPWFAALVFALAMVFMVAFILGYRTRLATLVIWIFLTSVRARLWHADTGGYDLLRMMAFWGMFLPLGAKYSVDDALRANEEPPPASVSSIGTACYMLQILLMYVITAALKSDPIWTQKYTALYFALSLEQFSTAIGTWMLNFPGAMKVLTAMTLYLEWGGPLLMLSPWQQTWTRSAVVLAFLGLHLGIALTMEVGPFPYVCCAVWLALIPSGAWDWLIARWERRERFRLQVYYDGECGFCNKAVLILRTFLLLPSVAVKPAQDTPPIRTLMEKHNSWVVVDGQGQRHLHFAAFLSLCAASPLIWPLRPLFALRPLAWLGDRIYRLIANNRRFVSRTTLWLRYRPQRYQLSPLATLFALYCLCAVISWNIYTLDKKRLVVPALFREPAKTLQIAQEWNMFAPYPSRQDGWFVSPGKLGDGTEVNVLHPRQPLNWDKPKRISATYKSAPWHKYMFRIWQKANAGIRPYFGRYLCRQWNQNQLDMRRQLQRFTLYYMLEFTPEPGVDAKIKRVRLFSHTCFKKRS